MTQEQIEQLLSEIEAFLARTGMGETYFGKKAAKNPYLVQRLRDGGRIWPETGDLVRLFIASHTDSANPPPPTSDAA
jgi:hypothetical protein